MDNISFDTFQSIDIRIGTIRDASRVLDTDKLVQLTVGIGKEERTIVAGIAPFVEDLSSLVGLQVPIVTNLEPRELRGVVSEGMLLAASDGEAFSLLTPETMVSDGAKVR